MKKGVELSLSREVEAFCANYRSRLHIAQQPSVKSIVTNSAHVAVTTLLSRRIYPDAIKNIDGETPIGRAYVVSRPTIEEFRILFQKVGNDNVAFDDPAVRSLFISSTINYCVRNIPYFLDDLYFVLTGYNPNQLLLALDDASYYFLVAAAASAGKPVTQFMNSQVVALLKAIGEMSEPDREKFLNDMLTHASTNGRQQIIPHFFEISGSGVDVQEIERLHGSISEERRPKFNALKSAIAIQAINESKKLAG